MNNVDFNALMSNKFLLMNNVKKVIGALELRSRYYEKRRHQCLANMINMRKKKMFIIHKILAMRRRRIWMKTRTSTFWENDIAKNSEEFFKENFRVSRPNFEILCNHLQHLKKQDTNYRRCIPLRKKVTIALYALGSSAEYRTIANLFGVGKCTVGKILKEFCQEIWKVLAPIYLSAYPLTDEVVAENVNGFKKLGFPQCFGAIDGCHIEVRPTAENAVDNYNYKGWYSTVLLAVVDYRYRFLYINVGSLGRCNDSQIFENSSVRVHHQDPMLKRKSISMSGVNVPVVLIGDSAFRFSDILMKPYPFSTTLTPDEKNFNYFLSKCRRVVENAFGHLKARFRRVGKGLDNRIDNTNLVIKACCVLHNFLKAHNDEINSQWLKSSTDNQREQPEFTCVINDQSPAASRIRDAISRHLVPAAAEVDGPSEYGSIAF